MSAVLWLIVAVVAAKCWPVCSLLQRSALLHDKAVAHRHTTHLLPPIPHPGSLLVLLIVALFYAGAAIIYKLALSPSKNQKLLEAQRRRRTRRD